MLAIASGAADRMSERFWGKDCEYGDGGDNILERGVLSCNVFYSVAWQRDKPDLTELARKRWVEKLSMDRIAADMGWGRTAIIRYLGKIGENPELILDGQVRLRVFRNRRKFMGKGQ